MVNSNLNSIQFLKRKFHYLKYFRIYGRTNCPTRMHAEPSLLSIWNGLPSWPHLSIRSLLPDLSRWSGQRLRRRRALPVRPVCQDLLQRQQLYARRSLYRRWLPARMSIRHRLLQQPSVPKQPMSLRSWIHRRTDWELCRRRRVPDPTVPCHRPMYQHGRILPLFLQTWNSR